MTTPDIAGLCGRLRKVRSQGIRAGKLWNEDGPEAADTIERQAAEIERLRATLGYYSYADDGGKRAIAALTGEDTATLGVSGKTQTGGDECTS